MKQTLKLLHHSLAASYLFLHLGLEPVEGDLVFSIADFAIRSCLTFVSLFLRIQRIRNDARSEKNSAPTPPPSSAPQ